MARSVQAPVYNLTPALTCAYFSYWSDVPLRGAEIYVRPDRSILAAPTNDGLTLTIVFWPQAAFHELLTDALDAGFAGRQPPEEALAGRQRQRDEAAAPSFGTTLQFAQLQPPPPEMLQLFAALRHNQEQLNRFMGTVPTNVPPHEFFAPENLAQIMAAA